MADDAFLSRWSRRKALARSGHTAPEPVPEAAAVPAPPAAPVPVAVEAVAPPAPAAEPAIGPASEAPPPPTLDDVARLPRDAADFSRFVARDVQPEVKNAALKKLFADPHFNVMDGLDIYIDDYSRPDPLPASMLRQMVQGRFLGLFADEETVAQAAPPADNPEPANAGADAPAPLPNEDADLRLQPDDAAGRPGPAAGAGDATERQP